MVVSLAQDDALNAPKSRLPPASWQRLGFLQVAPGRGLFETLGISF
jgi:hypothetical protein